MKNEVAKGPLVLATSNIHKVRELKNLLKPSFPHVDFYSLRDFPSYEPPEETGSSFEENALIKAQHAAITLKKWSLADDSGLVVPALDGAPGIYSARYAGIGASDIDNRKKLLANMQKLEGVSRSAYFECVLALSSPQGATKCARGKTEGEISHQEKGRHGFGYDPLFIKHGYQKTFAELDEEIKNKISHRAKALDKMLIILENLTFDVI